MNPILFWALQVFIAFNQIINALIPGGWADETLSSRAHRMRTKGHRYWGWTANAIDLLFFWQESHCEAAYLEEHDRVQLHPEFRGNAWRNK